ncbi:MAG: hypothetical protein PHR78_05250 [Eubacteriales bacterium]|nr:hypothetical protein [Eubacteriales bacterium]MDD4541544.1 hypothetical protein [Eubacteriales bacterium]
MKIKHQFRPVILGTDLNTYNVARTFHESYGIKSKVFGSATLLMTKYSTIVDITEVNNFADDVVMVKTLLDYAKSEQDTDLILFAASENYVFRIFQNYEALSAYYIIPYSEPDFGLYISDKLNFYNVCEEYGLDYPRAKRVSPSEYRTVDPGFSYPIVLKPNESADYFLMSFRGKEKAYVADNLRQLRRSLKCVYKANYNHDMLIQEFVRGPMSNEYVMNVYSDRSGKVRLMSLGRIILSDPLPEMRGNYIAITNVERTGKVAKLYEQYREFLEKIKFSGLANFDFKIDDRDGEFKCFEMNLRQGRSSYSAVMSGANYAEAIVHDLYGRPSGQPEVVYGDRPFVWLNCSQEAFYTLLEKEDEELYNAVKNIDNIGDTLMYSADLAPERVALIDGYFQRYDRLIKQY